MSHNRAYCIKKMYECIHVKATSKVTTYVRVKALQIYTPLAGAMALHTVRSLMCGGTGS